MRIQMDRRFDLSTIPLDELFKSKSNQLDVIHVNVPLFIRLLEFAREDAKDDVILHKITERILDICSSGKVAKMNQYNFIVEGKNEH